MPCPRCGAPISRSAVYCGRCGVLVTQQAGVPDGPASQPPAEPVAIGATSSSAGPSNADPVSTVPLAAPGAPPSETLERTSGAARVVCPRCRSDNEPGSRFCYRCGIALDSAPVQAAAPARAELEPGGFWVRLAAWLIDFLIVGLVQIIPAAVLFGDASVEAELSDNVSSLIVLSILSAPALYHSVAVAVWGTTIGKAVFGLRVVTASGRRPGIFRAFFRWLALVLSLVIFAPVVLVIVFDGRKRGLHDLICETRVVRR